MPSLGGQLRKVRLAAGLSQEALSYRAGVDRSYISQLERDLKSPTVDMLFRICQHLGVSASSVLAAVEEANASRSDRREKESPVAKRTRPRG